MTIFTKSLMVAAVLTGLASQAHAQGPADATANAPAQAFHGPRTGINTDVLFDGEEICGFEITVTADQAPQSFYHRDRNPWPHPPFPVVTQVGWNPNQWKLQFGGPSGPCFPRSTFFEGTEFKGLHFGFNTPLTIVHFQNSQCWVWVDGVKVACSGITGHDVYGWGVNVMNDAAVDVGIRDVGVAFSEEVIDIDILTRGDLESLEWESVRLDGGIVPARGSLLLTVPEHLRNQGGWAVFSFDIFDLKTSKHLSTATLQFKLP